MSEYGEATGKDTVRIERLLPGPIERVWAYLTESEKRGKWLASGEMELCVGGKVQLNFLHANLTPHQEPIPERFKMMECGHGFEGTIIQCEPPHLLTYTWGDDTSEVKFELMPQEEKVLLVITHTRLRDRGEMASVASGWHTHLGILEDNLLEQTPRPFWSTFERVEQEYKRRLPEREASIEGDGAVNTEENVTVQVTHRYHHPPEKVFDAWLNPEIARRFLFATETGAVVQCEIDPKVGGRFFITDRRDGVDVEHTGEYLEIDRPHRLKFTFGVPAYSSDMSVVTIDIIPIDGGCELTLTTELKREWADRTKDGWGRILRTLQTTIESSINDAP